MATMGSYGQYCPISRSAQLLGDRWTIHIIRDLLTGTSRFNELIRGNPGLSRALLSRRLRQLQTAGVVEQRRDGTYHLTDSGRDLEPVVFGLATWGARWTFGEPAAEELDPDLLLWWLHRQMDTTKLPGPRFTVYVPFTDHPKRYWIVVEQDASLCLADPGFDVDVTLRTDRASLYRTYLGHVSLAEAQKAGSVELDGSQKAVKAFFDAFRQSPVASIVRAESG
jgi:DNA-binding HxlR family transcriptional regulator